MKPKDTELEEVERAFIHIANEYTSGYRIFEYRIRINMNYPISILVSYPSLSKLISMAFTEVDVPGLGQLKAKRIEVDGNQSYVSINIETRGFFDGEIRLKGLPVFDKPKDELVFELKDLDMHSDSFFQKMGSSLSKPVIVKLLADKLKIKRQFLESFINDQMDNGLKTVFNPMKIESKLGAKDLLISNAYCSVDGLHINGGLSLKLELI